MYLIVASVNNRLNSLSPAHPGTLHPCNNNKEPVLFKMDSQQNETASDPRQFDSTGMFHWCPALPMSACVIVRSFAIFD